MNSICPHWNHTLHLRRMKPVHNLLGRRAGWHTQTRIEGGTLWSRAAGEIVAVRRDWLGRLVCVLSIPEAGVIVEKPLTKLTLDPPSNWVQCHKLK